MAGWTGLGSIFLGMLLAVGIGEEVAGYPLLAIAVWFLDFDRGPRIADDDGGQHRVSAPVSAA